VIAAGRVKSMCQDLLIKRLRFSVDIKVGLLVFTVRLLRASDSTAAGRRAPLQVPQKALDNFAVV
jgi:hypothetical protein